MKIKNLLFLLIFLIQLNVIKACPYTFTNDSKSVVFLADEIEKGKFVKPKKSVTVDAPMSPEHNHHEENHKWNGHAPVYVYVANSGEDFNLQYKIIEAACGKDSVIKFGDLEAMSSGEKDPGRFEIRKMTAERKEQKMQKLTEKGQKSLLVGENLEGEITQ